MVRDVVVLGSTGSVGTQALDIVRANPDRFRVIGLTAGGSNPELFAQQVGEFAPAYVGLGEEASTEIAGRPCDSILLRSSAMTKSERSSLVYSNLQKSPPARRKTCRMAKRACMCAWPWRRLAGSQNCRAATPARAICK